MSRRNVDDRKSLSGLLVLLTVSLTATAKATPLDTWSEPYQGVRLLHRSQSDPPQQIHAAVVDLSAGGVRVGTTSYEDRWKPVAEFARGGGYAIAINGGFWTGRGRPDGIAIGEVPWPRAQDDERFGFFAIRNGRALISPPEVVETRLGGFAAAVSGRPMLLRSGEIDEVGLEATAGARYRNPRTAVGVSHDGSRIMLVVADGRQERARGLTLHELARLLKELGAYRALNLDGGGSSTMFVEGLGGVINVPSGSRIRQRLGLAPTPGADGKVRGFEREVLNHVGVQAVPVARRSHASRRSVPHPGEPSASPVANPLPPMVRLGAWREWINLWWAAYFLPALFAGIGLFRYRRRRRLRSVLRRVLLDSPKRYVVQQR